MMCRRNARLKVLILSSVLGVSLLNVSAPTTVLAQAPDAGQRLGELSGRPGMPQRLLGPLFPILRRLQLSEDQRQQVRQILQGHRDDIRALMQREMEARRPLFAAVYIEPFNEVTVRDRSAAVAALQADGAVLRATIRTEVFGVLTTEQQTHATELLKRFVERRRGEADLTSPF